MSGPNAVLNRIVELLRQDRVTVGTHLAAQQLADRLRVSRSPVNQALARLHEQGLLRHLPNRGYFLAQALDAMSARQTRGLGLAQVDDVTRVYFQVAEDLLRGELPLACTDNALRARYDLTSAQLTALLTRIAQEGWIERTPGYGWAFSEMLTTPDSLLQSYRLRLALEPAALLEPGYAIAPEVLAQCRAAEERLLDGGIETDTPDQLYERGVRFHEALVEGSHNPFFIDTIRRVNRVRRLLSYRSMQDRTRYVEHCRQHLQILDLLEAGHQREAAQALARHLGRTLDNLAGIRPLLASP